MRILRLAVFVATVVAVLTLSRGASAHTVGISRGDYVWKDGTLWVGVAFARQELALALPAIVGNGDPDNLTGFENQRDALGQWLVERLSVSTGDVPCPAKFGGMRFDGDGLALGIAYDCASAAQRFEVDAQFVAELAHGHRHLIAFSHGGDGWEDVATGNRRRLRFELAQSTRPASAPLFVPLVQMGIEHILTGYDHLLFLLGLVLVGRPIRSLVGAVTAFTLAHSIALAVSASGFWVPSPRIIEPAIALSIAYVGIENWFVPDAKGRWRITFPFGLVHGFGFAGALRDIALPSAHVPLALFAFNLGVELGQIAVLAALLPLILAARKKELWGRVGMRTCTMTIAVAGVLWFVIRLRSSI